MVAVLEDDVHLKVSHRHSTTQWDIAIKTTFVKLATMRLNDATRGYNRVMLSRSKKIHPP